MIQFVWIIIKDSPVAGMRFIKMDDKEERARLEKFYGWLSGPISEFTNKVQDIVIEGTKYYYHSQNDVLFVVGADLEETSIPSIFLPELETTFFDHFDPNVSTTFDGKDTSQFRVIDNDLVALVKAFDQRKTDAKGKRKTIDAFEVLNLPTELQMVALVLVKMQVVTPDMVSQVTGLSSEDVERQLRDIYQRGYLYITTISKKSYFSIKPFESDTGSRLITRPSAHQQPIDQTTQTPAPRLESKPSKIDISQAQTSEPVAKTSPTESGSAMMAPPGWDASSIGAESSFKTPEKQSEDQLASSGTTIKPQLEQSPETLEKPSPRRESKGIKMKIDPIGREIDKAHRSTIVIQKNGFLPPNTLRREKGFVTGKIRIPSERNKDPLLLNSLFRRDIENIYEALFMGDFIVLASDKPTLFEDELVDQIFETMNVLTPHRDLIFAKSDIFVHPKDADVIAVPKDLLKYYAWATILDLDNSRVIGGNASEYSKNLLKKLRKITNPKEFLREITSASSILLKVGRDINTLKIEGRSPDQYLSEVRKAFGVAALDAGLTLSERLIRLHKDCAYIAGFYIRKGLDIAVRAVLVGEPIVVLGDDPLDVYHIIAALSIFAPHKAIDAQIWTTNFAEIEPANFDFMGAQEGTDKLFKGAVKVNLRSMSAYGGPRSEFLHTFLRKMWRRRSKERPKFIREKVIEMMSNINKITQKIQSFTDTTPSKQDIRNIFTAYDQKFGEFVANYLKYENEQIATLIKNSL